MLIIVENQPAGLDIRVDIVEDNAANLPEHCAAGSVDLICFHHAVNDLLQTAVAHTRGMDTVTVDWWPNEEQMIRWLDQSYKAMWDLTGRQPYGGDMIIIQESPPHPWYAYAGNPIVMDTTYVDKLIEEVNAGGMPFGWIHEMGHDFDDGIGKWYIWNGDSCEWQANWKLNYAYETIPDQGVLFSHAHRALLACPTPSPAS